MEQGSVPFPTLPDFVKSLNPEIETCAFFPSHGNVAKTCLCIAEEIIGIVQTGGCFTKVPRKQEVNDFAGNNENISETEARDEEKKEDTAVSAAVSAAAAVEIHL